MGVLNMTVTPYLLENNSILTDILNALGGGSTSPSFDSTGRMLVANPFTVFEAEFTYDGHPNLFREDVDVEVGTSTFAYNTTTRGFDIKTDGGNYAYYTSKANIPVQQTKPQKAYVSFKINTFLPDTGCAAGFLRPVSIDGVYVQYFVGEGLKVVMANDVDAVYDEILQANWNLDKLDGTGASGVTLDVAKKITVVIEMQAVRLGYARVGFIVDTQLIWAHQFNYGVTAASNVISDINLPIGLAAFADDTNEGFVTLHSATVIQEGGNVYEEGEQESLYFEVTTVNTSATHGITIKQSPTFNSVNNTTTLVLEALNGIMLTDNNPIRWELFYNATVTGGTDSTAIDGVITTTGGTATGGKLITGGFIESTGANAASPKIDAKIAQNYPLSQNDSLSIVFTSYLGASDFRGILSWKIIK